MPDPVICWKMERRLNAVYRDVLESMVLPESRGSGGGGSQSIILREYSPTQEKLHAPLKWLS